MKATTERLAEAMLELDLPILAELIERARFGYYDDYLSPLATPQIQLVFDLREVGKAAKDEETKAIFSGFMERVRDGEFDASEEESKVWMKGGRAAHLRADQNENAEVTADYDSVTYLTRRLVNLYGYLLDDPNVDYTLSDMLMAVHNFHVHGIRMMLEDVKDRRTRREIWRTAGVTFDERVRRELNQKK